MIITQPRPLYFETPFGQDTGIQIAAPRSDHGQAAARAIQLTLQEKGAAVEWLDDPEGAILRSADQPTIIVGNLADSQCIKELYYHSFCATDLYYPGPGGSELRTLCDPLGTGHNVITVGYSDEAGAAEAAQVFQSKLGDSIPHLRELNITRLPIADSFVEEYRTGAIPATAAEITNTLEGDNIGYLYYLTGEPKLGEIYRRVWQAIISCGFEKTDIIVQSHLFSLWRFLPWQLVEHTGLFNDEERLAITQYIYGWAQSDEGWPHVANCPRTQRPHNPRQNHELIPAAALMFVADYYETHYPELTGPEQWRTAGRMAFEPYGSSWKPLCDGLCHGITMSLPVMIEYGLIDPEHRFFNEGGVRQAAEYMMAVVNNDGWMPSAGDGGIARAFPGPILRIAADFLGDGRYKYLHDRTPQERRFGWQPMLARGFDSGVTPELPQDHIGITVIPIDPLVYEIWNREPELAVDAVTTPPTAPIEQCFDKLAVRTGWELADDYLLIDGLGGGSHSYDDAGGILDYARLGVSVIVQEDSLIHSAPEHHSLVTIVRDGETGIIPGFSILEEQRTDADGSIYLRIKSKDYAGADWVREIHMLPGQCAVFIDTVTANIAGDFAVEAHFRTPTRLELTDGGASGERMSPCCDHVAINLLSSTDQAHQSLTDIPQHLRYHKEAEKDLWKLRYRTDEVVLTAFAARETAALKKGESIRVAHLVQACAPNESLFALNITGDVISISDGLKSTAFETFPISEPTASSAIKQTPSQSASLEPHFQADTTITAMCAGQEGDLFVGSQSGTLCQLDSAGHEIWSTEITGPIHDIGYAQDENPLCVVGHGAAQLTAFDAKVHPQWTHKIEREPSPWPWWELTTPAPIQVAGGVNDGEAFFAVGCGDLQLRGFDRQGKQLWLWRYNEGVPGRVAITDVDGSGRDRIVVGGEILSDQATCRILESDGTQLAELEVEGWTSMLTALAFGNDGTRHLIGCGANRGNNLHLYESIAGGWRRNWFKRPGGQVTGIAIFVEDDRVIVATTQGFLLCYDLNGVHQWHHLFPHGLQHLARLEYRVVAIDQAGIFRVIDLEGNLDQQDSLPSPTSLIIKDQDTLYLACDSKLLSYTGTT